MIAAALPAQPLPFAVLRKRAFVYLWSAQPVECATRFNHRVRADQTGGRHQPLSSARLLLSMAMSAFDRIKVSKCPTGRVGASQPIIIAGNGLAP